MKEDMQNEWRRRVLAFRDGLSATDVKAKSRDITEKLFALQAFSVCRHILFFASFRSEVDTSEGIRRALNCGMRVCLPVTIVRSRQLVPRLVDDPALQLRPGYCGIPEPVTDLTETMDPQLLDVVLVPGSVFDCRGGRLGYGGGYYDRFLLNESPQALRIGLGFDVQVIEETLPLADHDQLLDFLVTETTVYRFSRQK